VILLKDERLELCVACKLFKGIEGDGVRTIALLVRWILLEDEPPGRLCRDVRAGSTKRIGAAIGEGAAVVAQIHSVLARN
jgi:hypothetical protein